MLLLKKERSKKSRINTHIFYAAVWTDSRAAEEGWQAERQEREGLKYNTTEEKKNRIT